MKVIALGVALALVTPALGDIVHLNDGTSVEGSVRRTRDGYVVTDASGKTTTIPADAVKSFELKSTAPTAGSSLTSAPVAITARRWASAKSRSAPSMTGGWAGRSLRRIGQALRDPAQPAQRRDRRRVPGGGSARQAGGESCGGQNSGGRRVCEG